MVVTFIAFDQQAHRRFTVFCGLDRVGQPVFAVSIATHRQDLGTTDDTGFERGTVPEHRSDLGILVKRQAK